MDILIWSGAVVSCVGLFGLVWCILRVWRARKTNATEDELRSIVRKTIPLNMGALFLSVIGLMMVIVGIVLG